MFCIYLTTKKTTFGGGQCLASAIHCQPQVQNKTPPLALYLGAKPKPQRGFTFGVYSIPCFLSQKRKKERESIDQRRSTMACRKYKKREDHNCLIKPDSHSAAWLRWAPSPPTLHAGPAPPPAAAAAPPPPRCDPFGTDNDTCLWGENNLNRKSIGTPHILRF
jgi:hypothetical protein